MTLATLALLWMTALVPPASVPWAASYVETAQAISDACTERPAFGSELRCAAVLVAVGYHESRFDPRALGDRGQSLGVWQLSRVWVTAGDDTAAQARTTVGLVERSYRMCGRSSLDEALSWYASGGTTCGRPASSRIRMRLAAALLR